MRLSPGYRSPRPGQTQAGAIAVCRGVRGGLHRPYRRYRIGQGVCGLSGSPKFLPEGSLAGSSGGCALRYGALVIASRSLAGCFGLKGAGTTRSSRQCPLATCRLPHTPSEGSR